MITVDTKSTSRKIVTADYAINRFGLASSDEENVEDVLDEVLSAFESYLGRDISWQTYTETVPGYGEHNLRLSRYPVGTTSVSVTFDSTSVSSTTYDVDSSAGLLFNSTGWKWTAALKGNVVKDKYAASEDYSYSVTYDAGWVMPSTSKPVCGFLFPPDLRGAALRTFKLWWTDLYGGSTSFKKFRTDDLEIENFAPPVQELLLGYGDIPESVERVLNRYKLEW